MVYLYYCLYFSKRMFIFVLLFPSLSACLDFGSVQWALCMESPFWAWEADPHGRGLSVPWSVCSLERYATLLLKSTGAHRLKACLIIDHYPQSATSRPPVCSKWVLWTIDKTNRQCIIRDQGHLFYPEDNLRASDPQRLDHPLSLYSSEIG